MRASSEVERSDSIAMRPVGNLRQRALAAAHRRLEAHGEDGLNLRAIAADIGTGVGSLYHHFRNKDALLAELAVDGFKELARWMTLAEADRRGRTPFHTCADAYLGFTRHRPALYRLMYTEQILARFATVRAAETQAFASFKVGLTDFGVPDAQVADVALTFWALGRGMAAISPALGAPAQGAAKDIVRRVLNGLDAITGESVRNRRRPAKS